MTPPTQQDKPIDLEALRLAADRELIELSAKAARMGYTQENYAEPGEFEGGWGMVESIGRFWNPLTDDGDALRLAVKLHLNVCSIKRYEGAEDTTNVYSFHHPEHSQIGHDSDMMAATRRAITQVAAEIGKLLP